jgi:hypothetical protein
VSVLAEARTGAASQRLLGDTRVVAASPSALLPSFARNQAVNVRRHLKALRDFRVDEFGTSIARPTEGHVQAVNQLLAQLRSPLERVVRTVEQEASAVGRGRATSGQLHDLLRHKSRAHDWVRATEKVWDFYWELFGQRQQSPYGEWLFSCDRIAVDCYQHVYMHLGNVRSIPSPPPFSYMRSGFSPATYRRNIPLRRLGRQLNPFPLVQLPYHRLVNPWTMGAIMHEVSHNLQNELELERAVPAAILSRLRAAGVPHESARVWAQWNREIFGDLMGCLFGGEAFIASLMDVIGRAPEQALAFNPDGVHPTPYLRTFLSTELLRRMGFPETATSYERAWRRLYPSTKDGSLPAQLLRTWPAAVPAVVDAVVETRFPSLGRKSLRQVITFEPRHQVMIEEAAQRLASGTDPGVVPERFLIGAVRIAVDRKLASPEKLMQNFYTELSRR